MQEKIIEENKAEFYDKVNNKRALMHKQSKEKATIKASFVKKKKNLKLQKNAANYRATGLQRSALDAFVGSDVMATMKFSTTFLACF